MAYNEAETRYHLIDPILRNKGYLEWRIKLETPAPVKPVGNKGRRRSGPGRTDYLLCVQMGNMPKPLPVAVIEAKAETEDPLKGMQQAKGYADCKRFHVQYVFATNGHRYGEFDKTSQMPNGPFPFPDFPTHDELTARYATDTGVDIAKPESAILFMADSSAYTKPRYYQDAATIQIGLTATPRQLRESQHQTSIDAEITANNVAYFGEPVYEYTLIQAQDDGYLAACEIVRLKPSVDWKTFTRQDVLAAKPKNARTGLPVAADDVKPKYNAPHFDDDLLIPERIAAMCNDLFHRLCANGGPEQKVIIFCTRDLHADRVAMQMQRMYAIWCKEKGATPKEHYAFKCTAEGGSDLIEIMRGSGERCFIACTVDLLATGVDIERLNAVVFFRYLQSSITFYQMVGRGTRIDEPTKKYKFWLYDYTGVTELFGTDFITKPPRIRKLGGGGEEGPEPPEEPPTIVEISGQPVEITPQGHFILMRREGRDVPVPVEEYRQEMIRRVLAEAHTLNDFRDLWIETQKRRQFVDHLIGEHYSPEVIRELSGLVDCDYYDLLAHYGYRTAALKRHEREAAYMGKHAPWFASVDEKAAIVLRGLGHQFGVGGTDALESELLWEVPEIKRVGGLVALKALGKPVDVVREAKQRLFGV